MTSLIQGPDNPAALARMSPDQVKAEAARLANNLSLTGLQYTAAVIQRLLEDAK